MAQKEARHREVVDELNEQIDHIQQERDELTSHVRYSPLCYLLLD